MVSITATINSPMSIPKNGALLSPYFMVDNNNMIDLNITLLSSVIGGGGGGGGALTSFNGRIGAITLLSADVTTALGYTPLANTQSAVITALTFTPMANTSSAVTTALGYTPVNPASAALINAHTAPTAAPGTNNTQIASTAFVQNAVSGSVSGVSSFNTRTGPITLQNTDVNTALGFTPLANTNSAVTTALGFTPLSPTSDISTNTFVATGTSISRTTVARENDVGVNVKDWGALGNTQTASVAVTCTMSSNIITFARSLFTSADVGKAFQVVIATATGTFSIGIYANLASNGDQPTGSPLVSVSGLSSTTATGVIGSVGTPYVLQPTTKYWIGIIFSAAPTVRTLSAAGASTSLGVSANIGGFITALTQTGTGSTLPAPISGAFTTSITANFAILQS